MKFLQDIYNTTLSSKRIQFALFFCILAFLGLWMMYFYSEGVGHDFYFHQRRFNALVEALRNGTFPYYTDYTAINGYGYLTKAFYSDFIFIPFAAIDAFTGYQIGYIVMIYVMTLLCGVFTYHMVFSVSKNGFVSAVSAILYTFAYYRILDIYRRGAMGEALSFTFLPIIFLGLYHIIKGDYKKWYILTIGFALLILTHIISSILMFVTLVILVLIYSKRMIREPKRIYYLILAGVVTLPLIAYFVLPLIEQMGSGPFYMDTAPWIEMSDSGLGYESFMWGLFYGIMQPNTIFNPGIGFMLTSVALLRIFVYKKSGGVSQADVLLILGIAYLVASMSFFPWNIYPFKLLEVVQLPWRLYEFVSLFFAIAGSYYLFLLLKTRKRKIIGLSLVTLCTMFVVIYDGIDFRHRTGEYDPNDLPNVENRFHLIGMEYLPAKVPSVEFLDERGDVVAVTSSTTLIANIKREEQTLSFDLNLSEKDVLELPLVYYKGYKVLLDGQGLDTSESENGLLQVKADKSGAVEICYAGTAMQKTGYYTTIISMILLCIYIFVFRKKNN